MYDACIESHLYAQLSCRNHLYSTEDWSIGSYLKGDKIKIRVIESKSERCFGHKYLSRMYGQN